MLIGEYAHTLDQKGRVNFPAKLLTDLGDRFILSKGLDGCLFVYSMEEWGNLERKIKELWYTIQLETHYEKDEKRIQDILEERDREEFVRMKMIKNKNL